MSTHQGPAILIVGNSEIPVEASLCTDRSGPIPEWNGSVQANDPTEDFYEAMNSDIVKLRLPDGREGDVVATRTSIGSGQLEIAGSGPASF